MLVTVKLTSGQDDQAIARLAEKQGVLVSPLSSHYVNSKSHSGLLLGFCSSTKDEIIKNVSILARIIKDNTISGRC